ncbi:MAG: hypothetical protein AAGN35_01500 [Bacteroidota bacterium]
MARINGVNSDYIKQGDGIIEVDPKPANLEMKLFICPYGQPSSLEAESNYCDGTDSGCPNSAGNDPGHALMQLSQSDGVRLQADGGNELRVHQGNGPITLAPASGTVEVSGALTLEVDGQRLSITPSTAGIMLEHTNGARVVFLPNGDLDLITKNNSGTVNIQGNLVVSGTLTRMGVVL